MSIVKATFIIGGVSQNNYNQIILEDEINIIQQKYNTVNIGYLKNFYIHWAFQVNLFNDINVNTYFLKQKDMLKDGIFDIGYDIKLNPRQGVNFNIFYSPINEKFLTISFAINTEISIRQKNYITKNYKKHTKEIITFIEDKYLFIEHIEGPKTNDTSLLTLDEIKLLNNSIANIEDKIIDIEIKTEVSEIEPLITTNCNWSNLEFICEDVVNKNYIFNNIYSVKFLDQAVNSYTEEKIIFKSDEKKFKQININSSIYVLVQSEVLPTISIGFKAGVSLFYKNINIYSYDKKIISETTTNSFFNLFLQINI
jgi:hypothetical protein